MDVYEWLVQYYNPGDLVYIFGSSARRDPDGRPHLTHWIYHRVLSWCIHCSSPCSNATQGIVYNSLSFLYPISLIQIWLAIQIGLVSRDNWTTKMKRFRTKYPGYTISMCQPTPVMKPSPRNSRNNTVVPFISNLWVFGGSPTSCS